MLNVNSHEVIRLDAGLLLEADLPLQSHHVVVIAMPSNCEFELVGHQAAVRAVPPLKVPCTNGQYQY